MGKKKRKKTSRNKYIPCDFPAIVDKENDTQMIEYARYNDNFPAVTFSYQAKD